MFLKSILIPLVCLMKRSESLKFLGNFQTQPGAFESRGNVETSRTKSLLELEKNPPSLISATNGKSPCGFLQ